MEYETKIMPKPFFSKKVNTYIRVFSIVHNSWLLYRFVVRKRHPSRLAISLMYVSLILRQVDCLLIEGFQTKWQVANIKLMMDALNQDMKKTTEDIRARRRNRTNGES